MVGTEIGCGMDAQQKSIKLCQECSLILKSIMQSKNCNVSRSAHDFYKLLTVSEESCSSATVKQILVIVAYSH